MSRDATGISPPLSSELLSWQSYRPTAGPITRKVTMGAIWVVIVFGCRELWLSLGGMESTALRVGIVGTVLAAGLWLGFRLVNWPRFAEFLINVESELKKVSWPTKTELWRASMVVVFTIVFMSVLLFGFDILWDQIGRLLRFIFG